MSRSWDSGQDDHPNSPKLNVEAVAIPVEAPYPVGVCSQVLNDLGLQPFAVSPKLHFRERLPRGLLQEAKPLAVMPANVHHALLVEGDYLRLSLRQQCDSLSPCHYLAPWRLLATDMTCCCGPNRSKHACARFLHGMFALPEARQAWR
jgi:hypothetical protein